MASAVPSEVDEQVEGLLQELASFSRSKTSSSMGDLYSPEMPITRPSILVSGASASPAPAPQHHSRNIALETELPLQAPTAHTTTSEIQNHLLRLQEITDAARQRAKQAEPPVKVENPKPQQAASPSSITEWAPALRHVSRLAARDPDLEKAVRRVCVRYGLWPLI